MTADTTTPRVGAVSRVLIGGAFALSVTAGFGIPWVIFLASIDLIRQAAAIGRELWERDPARHVSLVLFGGLVGAGMAAGVLIGWRFWLHFVRTKVVLLFESSSSAPSSGTSQCGLDYVQSYRAWWWVGPGLVVWVSLGAALFACVLLPLFTWFTWFFVDQPPLGFLWPSLSRRDPSSYTLRLVTLLASFIGGLPVAATYCILLLSRTFAPHSRRRGDLPPG
jgi:hypothetical protein